MEGETLPSCLSGSDFLSPFTSSQFYKIHLFLISSILSFPLSYSSRPETKGYIMERSPEKFFGKRGSFCLFVLWKWFIFVLWRKQQPFVQSMNSPEIIRDESIILDMTNSESPGLSDRLSSEHLTQAQGTQRAESAKSSSDASSAFSSCLWASSSGISSEQTPIWAQDQASKWSTH